MAEAVNGSNPAVKSPSSLAHLVLRTRPESFQDMLSYYLKFLGAHVVYQNEMLAFITYDDEHHRIALAAVPGTAPKNPESCGLHHTAFTFGSLNDLALTYTQRKTLGIEPAWCVNHGPTTSMYYKDPDGNMIECQVDNFATPDEATRFMMTKEFAENPIGTDFDPMEFVEKLRSGEDQAVMKKRIEVGPRGIPAM